MRFLGMDIRLPINRAFWSNFVADRKCTLEFCDSRFLLLEATPMRQYRSDEKL